MTKYSKNKFMAGAITAAMVATAVAPAVAAEEKVDTKQDFAFTDVSPANSHADNIYKAYDLGIMSGYGDGRFGPKDNLPRKHVVKALGKMVLAQQGLTIGDISLSDLADVAPFADVPTNYSDAELVLYSLIVKEAGIFEGSNNNLMPDTLITRQQMAQVLVNAFGLEDLPGDLNKVTDLDDAFTYYQDDIQILSENGVTNVESFRPRENTTRDQFASFLIRALDASDVVIPGPEPTPDPEPEPEPPVDGHNLTVEFGKASLVGDGADNTQVTLTVVDAETGAVATDADDIVLEVTTSHGTLGQERVTVQDGVANVTLTSEFTQEQLTATVQGKLIEAAADSPWHDEIGNLVASGTINFTPVASEVDESNYPSVVRAETNEADRVTVYFDKAVSPATFLQYENGRFVTDEDGNAVFLDSNELAAGLFIGQDDEDYTIRGMQSVAGNPNALEVILDVQDYPENPALTPNAQVVVDAGFTNEFSGEFGLTSTVFTFTDGRAPEFTGVTATPGSMSEITLKFSEPVTYDYAENAIITVNGQAINVSNIVDGEFWQNTGDYRDEIVVTTPVLNAGENSVQVSGVEDYAGNVVTSESLDFTVEGVTTTPAATIEVESPEQVRLNWNVNVSGFTPDEVNFQYWVENNDPDDDSEGEWVAFPEGVEFTATTTVPNREYVYELNQDWTQFVDQMIAEVDENGEEVIAEDFEYTEFQVRATVDTDAVTNPVNGLTNERQVLSLNAGDSPLNTFDATSPQIAGDVYRYNHTVTGEYVGYVVEFDEPVKAPGLDGDDTPSVLQGDSIPEVVVEFRGTDENGNRVVIDAEILGYFPDHPAVAERATSEDNAFIVDATEADLQALVDAGYGTDWELVVRNVTDDVGNAATTVLSEEFTITPTPIPAEVFTVFNANYDGVDFDTDADEIILDFSAAVSFTGGTANALNLSNYTVNGEDLPEGTSIALSQDTEPDADYYLPAGGDLSIVTITLPEGYLNDNGNNVINISRELTSRAGTAFTGQNEVTQDQAGTPGEPDPDEELPGGTIDEDDFSGNIFNGDVTVNIENLELLENATVRGTLTITGGTLGVPLELNNIIVEGDLDLSAFDGDADLIDVIVDGDTNF